MTTDATSGREGVRNDLFRTDHLMKDLKGKSVRGGIVTMASQVLRVILNTGATLILARLLTPADFGLVAMVTAVTSLVTMFKDAGMSTATVQRERISHEQISNLFWVNVGISGVLTLIVIAVAPLIANFYGEPRLVAITVCIACTFIVGGLTVQHQALIRRQMQFQRLAWIDIGSKGAGALIAIAVAVRTGSYWALVALPATETLATALGVWLGCRWMPSLPKRGFDVLPMIKFGGSLAGFRISRHFAQNALNTLVGWWWGATTLGIYSKAYGLLLMPIVQVNAPTAAVAIPMLSRVAEDPARYKSVLRQLQNLVTFFTLPGMALLFVAADWVIPIALGKQWSDAIPVFRWMTLAGFGQLAIQTIGWVFTTQNRTYDLFRLGLLCAPVVVSSFFIGLPWGVIGVAAAFGMTGCLFVVPLSLYWLNRYTSVSVRDYAQSTATPIGLAMVTASLIAIFRVGFPNVSPGSGLAASVLILSVTLSAAAMHPATSPKLIRGFLVRRLSRM